MGQSFLLLNSYFVKDIEPPLPPAMDWLVNGEKIVLVSERGIYEGNKDITAQIAPTALSNNSFIIKNLYCISRRKIFNRYL